MSGSFHFSFFGQSAVIFRQNADFYTENKQTADFFQKNEKWNEQDTRKCPMIAGHIELLE